MQLGMILIGGDLTVQQMAGIARDAEDHHFDAICMAEAWRSAWVPLTAMAAVTERIKLGPYILNAYGSSPFAAGMSAIDFQEFSNGRLLLGVGGGNKIINEQWQGIPHARVLRKMREYVTILQQIARTPAGETVRFAGEIHQMEWSPAVGTNAQPFPVYLAAVFPKMMHVAAQVADGIGGGGTLSPEYIKNVLKPRAATAAAAVDRDPSKIPWMSVAVAAVNRDRDRARRAAREAICHLYAPLPHPYYEYTMREQGFSDIVDKLLKLMPAGEVDAACDAITDECLDTIAIAGTLEDARATLSTYHDAVDTLLLLNASPVVNGDVDSAFGELLKLASP